jgi:hypothetical protein
MQKLQRVSIIVGPVLLSGTRDPVRHGSSGRLEAFEQPVFICFEIRRQQLALVGSRIPVAVNDLAQDGFIHADGAGEPVLMAAPPENLKL